jgi:hypothetical protein
VGGQCYNFIFLFAEKMAKILAFLTKITAINAETNDQNIDFLRKNANVFAENW